MARLQLQIAITLCRLPAQGRGVSQDSPVAFAECNYILQASRPREGFEPR